MGTVRVRLRRPLLRDVSMAPLAAFAVRCRCVVFDGLVVFVAFFVCEDFDVADVAAAVRGFVDLPPPRPGAVFFAAVVEPRLREVAGVVTGLTSTR
ncbi:hypothetical protein ACFV27_19745 [Streptomyces antimycoticus]|uniref:hypothetical protein n=1 Tax=Streptomyces TaxID=1883 RepID=UPI0013750909|nr:MULTISPECIES: hypothetical protein [Streptomyces]AJZ86864.2 hypothetical protein AS97_16625 [Streptomyces sp. AgN23]WJD95440.1 hypothetical protein QR300_05235 [Streptomyces antimycoticus]